MQVLRPSGFIDCRNSDASNQDSTSQMVWAIYLVSSDKRGLSALQLSRQLNVSYYVAWTMLHKLRRGMRERDCSYNLRGVIEIDESFFGGSSEGGGMSGRGSLKTPVIIEASTEDNRVLFAKMQVVSHVDGQTIKRVVGEDIAPGQRIRTDGWASYGVVKSMGHRHDREPVGDRKAHEVFKWVHVLASNAKAFLLGTFHGIGEKHLQTYLDEFCFRFNRRRWQGQLFDRLITACAASKGVTYSELTR